MLSRFIGGVLLIVGTSIGAGMLALPVANAAAGFWQSSLFLLLCWAAMTIGAFYILEANLYLPRGTNMISMATKTLGRPGLLIAWLSYLFLLYTLLSAYISGGSDVMQSLIGFLGIHLRDWQSSTLFTFVFGLVVYGGIHYVDYTNRILMFGKLGAYIILVITIAPFVQLKNLEHGQFRYVGSTLLILITSFGFAIIVPTLREYFDDDVKTLKKVILIGSFIPLICYLAWDAVIIGTLPSRGEHSLEALLQDPHTTSSLATMLSSKVQSNFITSLFNFFTSVCMLTAFLGVSLCLYSFLGDGLKLRHRGGHGLGLFALTFLPGLIIVIFYPGAYINALGYAGVLCVILLLLLPALMCLFGRKRFAGSFIVPGGQTLQWLTILISIALLIYTFYAQVIV